MGYRLENSYDTVQVLGPSLSLEAVYCNIVTTPSGSIVGRTVPKINFERDEGAGLLQSLADAVENAIAGGLAVAAVGTQGIDDNGLIFDAVTFTVAYVPSYPVAGTLRTTVEIPVDVLTADTSFGGFLTGGSAADRLAETYAKLKALAGE